MAAPIDCIDDVATPDGSPIFCDIEATVATGFEPVAKEEAEEKCGTVTKVSRGKINIKIPVENAKQVLELQGVDHCRVIMNHVPDFGFTDSQHDNLLKLRKFVGEVDWPHGLKVWRKFFSFEHPVADIPVTLTDDFGEVTEPVPRQSKSGEKGSKKSKKLKKRKGKDSEGKTETEKIQDASDEVSAVQDDTETKCNSVGGQEIAVNASAEHSVENKVIETVSSETVNQDKLQENISEMQDVKEESRDTNCSNAEQPKAVKDDETKKPRTRLNPWDPMKPAFRVTCNRVGNHHNFDSMTAAANFGGAIYRYFGWNVEMKNFDIEVMLNIEDDEVSVGIGLTRESLHRRNIGHFGATTLRPTIAYNMLRLCEIKTGDVVCDPMCGSGSIPIQSSMSWPQSFNICGDMAKKCIWRTQDNLEFMREEREKQNKKPLEIDVIKWDACNLPLRTHSVDVFITDLPFGLRVGSRLDNWKLYRCALEEMARVVCPETGRVCLLTQDKKCMIQTLQSCARYWTRTKTLGINIGGLAAGVFVLLRTAYQPTGSSDVTDNRAENS